MPVRTAREAINQYAERIRESLLCVTEEHPVISDDPPLKRFMFRASYARLNGTNLSLFFQHSFRVVDLTVSPWGDRYKVRTEGYIYSVYRPGVNGAEEIVAYHWHPRTTMDISYPHLHFSRDPDLKRKHFPTGRVSLESVLEFLIRDYSVIPMNENSLQTLASNRTLFEQFRTWC